MKNIWLISKRVYIPCFYEAESYEMIREETPETRTIKRKNTMMLQVTFLVEYNETLEPYRRLTFVKVSSD